jgi:hypothetical protein
MHRVTLDRASVANTAALRPPPPKQATSSLVKARSDAIRSTARADSVYIWILYSGFIMANAVTWVREDEGELHGFGVPVGDGREDHCDNYCNRRGECHGHDHCDSRCNKRSIERC